MRIVAVLGIWMAAAAAAAEIPRAVVVLESGIVPLPGQVAEAAPALRPARGRQSSWAEPTAWSRRASREGAQGPGPPAVRRPQLPSLAGVVTVGPGMAVRRLLLRRPAVEMRIEGDLAAATPACATGRSRPSISSASTIPAWRP